MKLSSCCFQNFFITPNRSPVPIKQRLTILSSSQSCNHNSTFCFYDFDYCKYLIILVGICPLFFFLIYLFLAALGLRCCTRAFSSCGKRGLLFVVVCRLLLLQSTGSRYAGSVVVAQLWLSCSAACGILLDQGLNPCPLHWPADS